MNRFAMIVLGVMFWQSAVSAQQVSNGTQPGETQQALAPDIGVVGATSQNLAPEYAPLTASERWRQYFQSGFGPLAILRAAAAAGISQWTDTPKEWRGGAEAYGERFGNSFAKHVVRKTLEAGASAALHEDNRYVYSTDTGVWNRTKHVIASVFTARNEAGSEHFAYSRFGGALSASFISRLWQPRSVTTSGGAAVNFGITIATDLGWNAFKEFRPKRRAG
jgi:hypothetical protein